MKQNTLFISPLEAWKKSPIQPEKYYQAKKLFENQEYLKSLHALFDHLSKKDFKKYKIKNEETYIIPNYKNWITIRIVDNIFSIEMEAVSFLPENVIIIWRKMMELQHSFFSYPKVFLENNTVILKYSCYLENADPQKILQCIIEISLFSLIHTEELIYLYDSQLTREPQITFYSDTEYTKIFKNIQTLLKQNDEYTEYFEKRLESNFTLDTCFQTLLNLFIYLQPKWKLRQDLIEWLDFIWNNQKTLKDKISFSLTLIEKIKKISEIDLKNSIYKSTNIFLTSTPINPTELRAYLQEWFNNVKSNKIKQNDIAQVFDIKWRFLCALYNYQIEDKNDYKKIITLLTKSNHKTWEQASKILYQDFHNFMIYSSKFNLSFWYALGVFWALLLNYFL